MRMTLGKRRSKRLLRRNSGLLREETLPSSHNSDDDASDSDDRLELPDPYSRDLSISNGP